MPNRVTLDKIKIGLQHALSNEMLDVSVDFQTHLEYMAVMRIRGYVWGESAAEPKVIRYPRDWWQAFKGRWFPAWALRRWPVIHTIHTIDAKVLYPNLKVQLPHEKHSLVMDVWQEDDVPWRHKDNDVVGDILPPP